MGRDISSHEAVLVGLLGIVPLFRNRSLAAAFAQYCLAHETDTLHDLLDGDTVKVRTLWDYTNADTVIERGAVRDRLSGVQSGRDLHRLLGEVTYACQDGNVGKYGHTYINKEEKLVRLWNLYIKSWNYALDGDMPEIESIQTFGSGRNCDWAVREFGHPFLAFSSSQTFEYVLTDKGRAMQEALGKAIGITTWTTVSE